MSRLLYYLLVKPLSLLPLPLLYGFSNFLYMVMYYLVGYRKKVVFQNLKNSFPEKSKEEITGIAKLFYRHFCDLMVESVRLFSISKKEALKRLKVTNPEFLDAYAEQGKSVILVAAHYNNWELAAVAFQPQLKHKIVGLIAPVKDPFFYKKFIDSRTKFGTSVISMHNTKDYFKENKKVIDTVVFIGDQSPSSAKKKLYWTQFLNQETGVMLGAEKYAKAYDYPVVFVKNKKVKRGYYEMTFVAVEDHPTESAAFAITEKHLRILEQQIQDAPQYWLWTHRRWKRKRVV